jgi:hypothetical protein
MHVIVHNLHKSSSMCFVICFISSFFFTSFVVICGILARVFYQLLSLQKNYFHFIFWCVLVLILIMCFILSLFVLLMSFIFLFNVNFLLKWSIHVSLLFCIHLFFVGCCVQIDWILCMPHLIIDFCCLKHISFLNWLFNCFLFDLLYTFWF